MKKPQILILGLVYGFLSVYRLLGSDLTNVKGTVAIASKLKCLASPPLADEAISSLLLQLPNSLGGSCPKNQFITNYTPLTGEARACPEPVEG